MGRHSNMRGKTMLVLLGLLVVTHSKTCGKERKGMKRICASEAKDSARLNKAGYYILNNEKKFYIPEKVDADCDQDRNNEKCPRRCVDDEGQDGICYERVCPPYTPCTNRKGRVLMVNKGGYPFEFNNIPRKEWRGFHYSRKRPALCRCFIPRNGWGGYEKPQIPYQLRMLPELHFLVKIKIKYL